jgi:hypothetical protein
MTPARRLIPNSPGHGFRPVSGRERVGNEAAVLTWFQAGDGLVAKQLVFGVTRSDFAGRCDGVIKTYDRTPRIASRLTGRPIGRALEEAGPNKSLLPTGLGPSTSTPDLFNRPAAE